MSAKTNDFKLGLFVLVAIGLLVAGLFVFGASRLFQGKTVVETYIQGNVTGLKTGSQVTLRGVPVGEVTRINFTWNVYHKAEPRYVLIDFDVDNDIALVPPGERFAEHIEDQVRQGLRARVKTQGLAGATILSLEYVNPAEYPPLPVAWKPKHIYIPSAPSQFSQILSSLDTVTSKVKQIDFEKLGQTLQRDLAAAERDLAAGERLLKNLNRANVPQIATNANALLADLRGVSAQLRTFMGKTNQLAQANLPAISSNAEKVLVDLQNGIGRLNRVLANLDTASLNETLDNLQRASQQLEETIRKFRQYPSGALFGEPPPPAKSVVTPHQE